MAVEGHTLEFCLAEEADFEEVMSISGDVYGGIDYLPARYHAWIQDSVRRVILAKKKGQIVALVSVNIVDDGHTAVVEGLRVAPLERGKGIAGLIQGYSLNLVKDQFPEVKVRRYVRSGQLAPEILTKFRLICKQFKAEDIRPKLEAAFTWLKESGKQWEDPVLLGASEAKRLFLSQRVVDEVLPGKAIIQDWVPYKPLESNLEKLVSQDFIWMADDKEEPTVLSLGTAPYRVPLGTGYHRLNIDIFGKQFPRARNQFLAQLQQRVSTLEGPIYCLLYFEPSIWQDMLSFCQTTLELHKDRDFGGQNLLEADM
ncbi:histidine N-acetyltransferase isoform X2 [Stegostoma tigrinum]|uniref:histidine N-acetyltransferase isoform X2 n=1 Tax=Stegostoma tigrinum TaxID=3053191 RepID=UPI00287066F5|nr:histidine N-acetyltransferase isoform X2 [Stegostoma tigrinum]